MNSERIRSLLQFPLYQPIEHPDFAGEPVQLCEERLQQILLALPVPAVSREPRIMADFGCHTGWFCRAFARMGWRTLGVDRSPEWLEVASMLNELLEEDSTVLLPRYKLADVLEVFSTYPAYTLAKCDVALCLSIAMYLFEDPERGWAFFRNVSNYAQIMFLDFGGMYLNRVPFNEHEIGELMIEKTDFQSWRKIGTSDLGRSLFMFTR